MTAYLASSPTLSPFDQGGMAVQLAQSPSKHSTSFGDFYQQLRSPKSSRSHNGARHERHAGIKGLDSADLEARRQEQAEILWAASRGPHDLRSEEGMDHSSSSDIGKSIEPTVAPATVQTQAIDAQPLVSTVAASNDADFQGPFEGPEKLLELWFADSPNHLPPSALATHFTILQDAEAQPLPGATPVRRLGLRAVPRPFWEEMLDIVHCKVLSVIESQEVDAYLLSESSMFVFPHKIILKTCGTTTLLLGLERLLQLVKVALSGSTRFETSAPAAAEPYETADAAQIAYRKQLGGLVRQCFYSRKSFMFPERQKGPHKDWMLEVGVLDNFFESGSAYTVGKMNGDHWLLYMCCPGDENSSEASGLQIERPLQLPPPALVDIVTDQTLEILMTELAPAACKAFEFPPEMDLPTQPAGMSESLDRGHVLGLELSKKLGLTDMLPDTKLDSFAFEPCGYSANAVIPAGVGSTSGYWTIHVTPEDGSSYASFETNVSLNKRLAGFSDVQREQKVSASAPQDLPSLVQRVASIFQPGKMSITLFTSRQSCDGPDGSPDDSALLHSLKLPGYDRKDRIFYEFENYDLVFCHFETKAAAVSKRLS